jgi:predicted DNA-binding transcriptional regulator AlpA
MLDTNHNETPNGTRKDLLLTAAETSAQAAGEASVLSELRAIRHALEAGRTEAIGAADSAALCGISKPSWDRMNSAGKTPQPIRLLGSVRWMRAELLDWLAAGAPDRARWEAMKRRK